MKRKRKKLAREPSFFRDIDESSTTTEKSFEDYEIRVSGCYDYCDVLMLSGMRQRSVCFTLSASPDCVVLKFSFLLFADISAGPRITFFFYIVMSVR